MELKASYLITDLLNKPSYPVRTQAYIKTVAKSHVMYFNSAFPIGIVCHTMHSNAIQTTSFILSPTLTRNMLNYFVSAKKNCTGSFSRKSSYLILLCKKSSKATALRKYF